MFRLSAIPDRLAEQTMAPLLTGQFTRFPSAPGQHYPVYVDFILDGELKMVECFSAWALADRRKL